MRFVVRSGTRVLGVGSGFDSVDFGFWGTESGGVDAGRLMWI